MLHCQVQTKPGQDTQRHLQGHLKLGKAPSQGSWLSAVGDLGLSVVLLHLASRRDLPKTFKAALSLSSLRISLVTIPSRTRSIGKKRMNKYRSGATYSCATATRLCQFFRGPLPKKLYQPSTVMDTEMRFDASSFLNSVQHLSRTLTRSLPRLLLPAFLSL